MSMKMTMSWLDLRIDLRSSDDISPLLQQFDNRYQITRFIRQQLTIETLPQCKADIICFEYDYPDIPSLNLLQEMHNLYPDSPILMFTEQHSEALAVWAFRTGVWDYFVLPLSESAIAEVINSLSNANEFCFSLRQQFEQSGHVRLPDEVRFRAPPVSQQQLQPALNYLEIHYSQKMTEEDLAKLCSLTVSQFSRQFKQAFDITFQEYLVNYRLTESARLLQNPAASISDIAYSVGFNDPSYYARAFKKHLGVTPSRFRQLLKENNQPDAVACELLKTA